MPSSAACVPCWQSPAPPAAPHARQCPRPRPRPRAPGRRRSGAGRALRSPRALRAAGRAFLPGRHRGPLRAPGLRGGRGPGAAHLQRVAAGLHGGCSLHPAGAPRQRQLPHGLRSPALRLLPPTDGRPHPRPHGPAQQGHPARRPRARGGRLCLLPPGNRRGGQPQLPERPVGRAHDRLPPPRRRGGPAPGARCRPGAGGLRAERVRGRALRAGRAGRVPRA